MAETLASQKIMLERKGIEDKQSNEEMARFFEKHLFEIEKWLGKQANMNIFYVNYSDILENPLKSSRLVNAFLGRSLNMDEMVNAVDKSLYRNRKGTMHV